MDELVAEALAVAENDEIERRGEAIVREHQRQHNEDVDGYRRRRAQQLHDWTHQLFASPLLFPEGQTSSRIPPGRGSDCDQKTVGEAGAHHGAPVH
jgi:hypothetical protein